VKSNEEVSYLLAEPKWNLAKVSNKNKRSRYLWTMTRRAKSTNLSDKMTDDSGRMLDVVNP
tara:strand:+ start:226 stop:408 length:183 start_codon:yes stop_codon:yes gene_type:complete